MNALQFRPIFQETFTPDLFDWRRIHGTDVRDCDVCKGSGQDPNGEDMGCHGCRGHGRILQPPMLVCERVTRGQAMVQGWYCSDLGRVIVQATAPMTLDEEREDGQDLESRANRLAGVTTTGLVVRTASTEAQAIRKAVSYCDRYRDAWRAISHAPADMEGQEKRQDPEPEQEGPQAEQNGPEAEQQEPGVLHVEPPHSHPFQDLGEALAYCLGENEHAPEGFVHDHADLLAFGDAREDGDTEQADQHYTRLRESLMVTHADHDQARDMLADARTQLAMIGEAVGMKPEPHQGYFERLLETVTDMAAADSKLKDIMALASLPAERLIDAAFGQRRNERLAPAWLAEMVVGVFETASATVHANHKALYGDSDQVATVAYNLEPAAVEGAIRDKLEAMGWIPPEKKDKVLDHPLVFILGELSDCGPDGETIEGKIVYSDTAVAWELDGASQLAEYIRTLELQAEAGAEAYLALIPAHYPKRAPWPDMHGRVIYEGDTIRHPSGQEGVVLYRPDRKNDVDRWLVDYGDGVESRLVLQITEQGQAAVQR